MQRRIPSLIQLLWLACLGALLGANGNTARAQDSQLELGLGGRGEAAAAPARNPAAGRGVTSRLALPAPQPRLALPAPTPPSYEQLPPAIVDWIHNEQRLLSRDVDSSILVPPRGNEDSQFAPERGATFRIRTVWVDADSMHVFEASNLEPEMRALFVRTANGKQQVRLLVHPESEGFYRSVTATAEPGEDLFATSTASSRTLVVWRQGHENTPFFVKVSLDRNIGGVVRTVPASEVARSIGTANVLATEPELPDGFHTLPEVLSMIPRGMARGGMIVRAIPREILDGTRRFVPLFSLYASPGEGQPPMLARMIAASGMTPEQLVDERIIRPFTRMWVKLAVEHGITSEPHAQNVLLEVGRDGLPTGQFLMRDFGGFDVDFPMRDALGRARPAILPHIGTFEHDYHLDENVDRFEKLHSFFVGGFVHNLDQQVESWRARGWVSGPPIARRAFTRMVARRVAAVAAVPDDRQSDDPSTMSAAMQQARTRFLATHHAQSRSPGVDAHRVRTQLHRAVQSARRGWSARPSGGMRSPRGTPRTGLRR